jgi:acyl carrier protein
MRTEIETTIREILTEVREGYDFGAMSPDTTFGDAGLDSLDSASLLLGVQDVFGVQISDDEAEELDTIGKLSEFLKTRVKPA